MRCDAAKLHCQPTIEGGYVDQIVVSDKIASVEDSPARCTAVDSRSATRRQCPNIKLAERSGLASAVIQALAHAAQCLQARMVIHAKPEDCNVAQLIGGVVLVLENGQRQDARRLVREQIEKTIQFSQSITDQLRAITRAA